LKVSKRFCNGWWLHDCFDIALSGIHEGTGAELKFCPNFPIDPETTAVFWGRSPRSPCILWQRMHEKRPQKL